MMKKISVVELKSKLAEVLNDVQFHRAEYLIHRRGKIAGMILPVDEDLQPALDALKAGDLQPYVPLKDKEMSDDC